MSGWLRNVGKNVAGAVGGAVGFATGGLGGAVAGARGASAIAGRAFGGRAGATSPGMAGAPPGVRALASVYEVAQAMGSGTNPTELGRYQQQVDEGTRSLSDVARNIFGYQGPLTTSSLSVGGVLGGLGGAVGRAMGGGRGAAGVAGGVVGDVVRRLVPGGNGGGGCGCGSDRDPCTRQKIGGGEAPNASFFGGCCPPGRVLRRIGMGRDICIKQPRMNPFNPRALARADRRLSQFARRSTALLKDMGYQVSRQRKVKVGKKRRRRAA